MLFCVSIHAQTPKFSWYTLDKNNNATLNVALFLSTTCPHCYRTDSFFNALERQTPWINITRHYVNQDTQSLMLFNQLLTTEDSMNFSIPSIFFCKSRWIGFQSDNTTGAELLKALTYCKTQIEKNKSLKKPVVDVLKRWSSAVYLNGSIQGTPSASYYFMLVSIFDTLNPCSLFCFMAFLGVVLTQPGTRLKALTGALFVAMMGLSHFIIQTYSFWYFEQLAYLRALGFVMGLVTLVVLLKCYFNSRLSLIGGCLWSSALGLLTYLNQQSCTLNWSLVFEDWLLNQSYLFYFEALVRLAYQLMYLVLPSLVLLLMLALNRFAFFKTMYARLEIVGYFYLLGVAAAFIAKPAYLTNYFMSFICFSALTVVGLLVGFFAKGRVSNNAA